ncbi:glycosyltransferase [Iningainema tapete]|uniref:Glycosyltransferase n=1 Tax=Iningainema tapete BLCC-T55 TaxID=2748662 RepID=A0A8J7C5L3_9CYAN|nr:glycosyltransferase [Iningainema tapete]MBD2773234.1 glycosyltransferase [Iningainema tapete BLCC-T55]
MKRIAFFLPTLNGGGAERVTVNLLKGMLERNLSLDLVIATAKGPFLKQIPKQVHVVDLTAGRVIKAILPLSRYLQQHKPCALVSHTSDANVVTVLAKKLARTKTKLMLVEHNTLSVDKSKLFRAKFVPPLMKWFYPSADDIVGVSQGVAQDLELQLGFPKGKVSVIYNPVVDRELITKAKTPLNHPWFQTGTPPVFLAVGRLTEQKDFPTLIKAFALLRKQRLARLLILGEGECRAELERMIDLLEIANDVSLPGFVENPYGYMHNASAFILSSLWEGLPTVLIEAMACGCPVVATDCPSGPNEILAGGKYGRLVPVGNSEALAAAMFEVLESPVSRDVLLQRAMHFSVESAVSEYLALLGYP